MTNAPGAMLYWEMFEMLLTLPEDKMKQMLQTIYHFARGEEVEALQDPMLQAVWKLTEKRIAEDRERYEKICRRNQVKAYKKHFQKEYAPTHGLDPKDEEAFEAYLKQQLGEADNSAAAESELPAVPTTTTTTTATTTATKKKEKKKAALSFSPPSAAQVEEYCREKKLTGVNPRLFVDFYASIGWKVGNRPMKDWQAAARSWNERRGDRGKTELSASGCPELAGHL